MMKDSFVPVSFNKLAQLCTENPKAEVNSWEELHKLFRNTNSSHKVREFIEPESAISFAKAISSNNKKILYGAFKVKEYDDEKDGRGVTRFILVFDEI